MSEVNWKSEEWRCVAFGALFEKLKFGSWQNAGYICVKRKLHLCTLAATQQDKLDSEQNPSPEDLAADIIARIDNVSRRAEWTEAHYMATNMVFQVMIEITGAWKSIVSPVMKVIMALGRQFTLTGAIGVTLFAASQIYGSTLTAVLQGYDRHPQTVDVATLTWSSFFTRHFNDNDAAYHDTVVDAIAIIFSLGLLGVFLWIVDHVASTNARFAGYPRTSIVLFGLFQVGALRILRSPYDETLWNTCIRESTTVYCSTANAMYWYSVLIGVAVYVLTHGGGVFYTKERKKGERTPRGMQGRGKIRQLVGGRGQ